MKPLRLLLVLGLSLAFVGCDDEEENQESTDPLVGVMELPIAYRYETAAPSGAVEIEVSPSNLRVDAHTVVELDNGKIPDAALVGGTVTELKHAVESGPARRGANLRILGSTPWRTTTLVLQTLKEAGVTDIAFEVRQGAGTEAGYMALGTWDIREQEDEFHEPPATYVRNWDELAPLWEEMYGACREGPYVDCAFKPGNIAEGGRMHMTLFARGNGVKIDLQRVGGPDIEESAPAAPAMIDGIAPPEPAEGEEELPPATTAAFTWRYEATTPGPEEENVVAKTMRPLCGAQACGALVEAEAQTPTMRVISFLGAAFPNGTDAPYLMLQIPPKL